MENRGRLGDVLPRGEKEWRRGNSNGSCQIAYIRPVRNYRRSRLHLAWQFATISVPNILDLSSISHCGNISWTYFQTWQRFCNSNRLPQPETPHLSTDDGSV